MKKLLIGALGLLVVAGCVRNRFDYIDIASSEKALAALEAGFEAVPDSVADGRTVFLLSQGVPVADVLVYAGETGDVLFKDPAVPFGYACETVGTDVLMDSLHVKAGRLYTDAGLNARMLYLQDARMSLPVLNKISEFAAQERPDAVPAGCPDVTSGVEQDFRIRGPRGFHRRCEASQLP